MSKHTIHGQDNHQEKKHTPQNPTEAHAEAPQDGQTAQVGGKSVPPSEPGSPEAAPKNPSEDGKGKGNEEALRVRTELEAKIVALEAEISNLKDQYLRKAAEFENFRKRMQKEKQDAIDYANQSLLLDLIPVLDDFERAIKSSEVSKDFEALHEGISLIEKRLVSQLENKWGLSRFESAGTPFDPNRHEAIMMEKTTSITEPMVGEDFVKGYTLKNRVIRSAKVKVLMPEEGKPAEGSSSEGPVESESGPSA
jgi:molecular chaperone GrpE